MFLFDLYKPNLINSSEFYTKSNLKGTMHDIIAFLFIICGGFEYIRFRENTSSLNVGSMCDCVFVWVG